MSLASRLAVMLGAWDRVVPRTASGLTQTGHLPFGRRRVFFEGHVMPHLKRGGSTYSVQTMEGWWANVAKGRLTGWSQRPIHRVATWRQARWA